MEEPMNAFDPEEWVEVAELCCDNIPVSTERPLLRTALNRAYYAPLLSIRERIEREHGVGAVPRIVPTPQSSKRSNRAVRGSRASTMFCSV
jgi:hypothetical protein